MSDTIDKVDVGLEAIALVQMFAAAIGRLTALPGFGTAEGISDDALAALRSEEAQAQLALAKTIAAMPG